MRISGAPAFVQRPAIEPQGAASRGAVEPRAPVLREEGEVDGARPRHELPRHYALRRALAAYLTTAPAGDATAAPLGARIVDAV